MLQIIIPAIYTSSPALKEGAPIRGEALNTVFRVLSRPYGLTNIFYRPLPHKLAPQRFKSNCSSRGRQKHFNETL